MKINSAESQVIFINWHEFHWIQTNFIEIISNELHASEFQLIQVNWKLFYWIPNNLTPTQWPRINYTCEFKLITQK